ncbi:uncharacterized protein ARMOST_02189 [Armillaria ostoyae]|uniref:HNH nuclease domain-containing protein n=1 Tax=Armillaria ostoyae TaxID=47428 RepID=A0A284QR49_ARMOS|nr:uncharacterized protein ARMOST_02189 [Armillaria ostoyae]
MTALEKESWWHEDESKGGAGFIEIGPETMAPVKPSWMMDMERPSRFRLVVAATTLLASVAATSIFQVKMSQRQNASKPHEAEEAQDLALGFRCVVSDKYDQVMLSEVSAPTDEIWEPGVQRGVLAVLKSFGYTIEQLKGTNVHSLSNIITMQSDVHESFTRLEIWFEKTGCITPTPPYPTQSQPHYAIQSISPYPEITSTTPDNENLPVPSSPARYLCKGRPVFWGG